MIRIKITGLFLLLWLPLTLFGQKTEPDIDPRIRKHYSEAEIQKMLADHPEKLAKLNFYFRSSFLVIKPVHAEKSSIDPATIDIWEYEHLRMQDERARTGLRRDGHVLELLSLQELEKAYQHIETDQTHQEQ